ncbi:hypothetical protein H0V99_02090 [Candidatus Saccharibacteria bacterium]|nr:hypothetical protein [Candidatus Saccharibacteria bacterium]
MNKLKKYGKVILFDTLAGLCFIGVALFGWLPGPGGIPLLILGLSLLAVNHDWAERWMETVKYKGTTLKKYLFPSSPWVRLFYDFGSVVIILGGIYVLLNSDKRLLSAVGTIMITFGLVIFLFNRDRFDKIAALFKSKSKP